MSNYGGHNNGYHGGHRQNSLDGVVGESDVNGGGEGSLMGEDLPNGFTKIRSKNLDVLFKKDYYATAAAQKAPKPEGEGEEASENPASEKDSEGTPPADTETAVDVVTGDADTEGESTTNGVKDAPELTEKGEENKENEKESGEEAKEKTGQDDSSSPPPLKSAKKLTIRTDASPFYPRSYQFHNNPTDPSSLAPSSAGSCQFMPTAAAATTGDQQQTSVSAPATAGAAGAKPNLFLYSPASNTIIPCEEIMIPNHSSAASTATTATVATAADAQVAAAGYHPGAAAAAAHHHSVVAAATAAAAAAGPNIYMTGYPQHDGGYLSAPATAPAATTTFPPPQLINPMVHYDQFGVAYTSYVPPYANTPPVTAAAAPPTAAANAGGQQPTAPPETYSPQQQQQLSDSSSSPAASSTSPASVSENGATTAAVTAGSR